MKYWEVKTFGDKIKFHLVGQERTQAWLAEATGMRESTISQIVNGIRRPSITTALKISTVLKVSLDDLFKNGMKLRDKT